MRSTNISNLALVVGVIGAVVSLIALMASGSGDHPEAYLGYLQASAILIGSAVIASAISGRTK